MALPTVYMNNDEGTFGYFTAHVRWPIIVNNAIKDVEQTIASDAKLAEQGQTILAQLKGLHDDLVNDASITSFADVVPACFKETLDTEYNGHVTWKTGPWLYLEITLYRLIDTFVKAQSNWVEYDIFNNLKQETFNQSMFGVTELAIKYKALCDAKLNDETAELLFRDFVDISLWGNATDLSLLTNATLEDIKSLQGADARKASESKILVNDTAKVWEHLSAINGPKNIDIVLDNSGFELYADLMLVLFLLDHKLVDKVTLHGKDIPYMVSDVMIKDFGILVADLRDASFFPEHRDELEHVADAIEKYVKSQQLSIVTDPFWTLDLDFWHLDPSSKYGVNAYNQLKDSSLVIFKGDLNYRKLVGDRKWDPTTPWATAIGPLATNGLNVLSLRTCKADVVVDLPKGKYEELCDYWVSEGNEHGNWWTASGKWAVICFNKAP